MEEVLNRRAVKTTIQILHDKGVFDSFPNADKDQKNVSRVDRRRLDLEQVNDVIKRFCL